MNVVSIDFDIIMEPDINMYNNWVGTDGDNGINDLIQEYSLFLECGRLLVGCWSVVWLLVGRFVGRFCPHRIDIYPNFQWLRY